MLPNLNEISNSDICDEVERAKKDAILSLEDLGIFVKEKDGKWKESIINIKSDDANDDADNDNDNDDDDDEGAEKDKEKNGFNTVWKQQKAVH